jgi:hypothetical protein
MTKDAVRKHVRKVSEMGWGKVVPDKVENQTVHRITYLPVANPTIYTSVVGYSCRKVLDPAEKPLNAVPPTNMGE